MQIDCGVCALRSWRAGDQSEIARHANDPGVAANLRDAFPSPYTPADADAWITFCAAQQPELNFAIDVGGAAVGGVGFALCGDIERHTAEVGYWLGREYWGRGIATAALRAAVTHMFATHGLLRIYAVPFSDNASSRRVLEKAGFACEGILRSAAVKHQRVHDLAMYARIAPRERERHAL